MLAGREEFLAELHARLTGNSRVGPQVVPLCGLGGAGKTSVAVEYAHRHQATAGVVWQFAAEDPVVLADGFARLAAQLGATDGVLETRDPVPSVHAVLAASAAPWLLVFDNAPAQEAVAGFLPPAGNGRVLITSQSGLWPLGQALEVPTLDTETAAGFLIARTGDPDEGAAAELASELGGLPLALEQAGAYINAAGATLAGYLDLFRSRRRDLLTRGEPAGYNKTVATTWALALARLEHDTPTVAGLLRLLACCAPEPVPLRLLLRPSDSSGELSTDVSEVLAQLVGDPIAVGDAVASLRRYSLVTPAGEGLVLVHRLVQAVTLDQMPDGQARAWRHAAATLIEAAIPGNTDSPETWPACAALLPHARAALADHTIGMTRIANYLGASGSYAAARDRWQKIAEACERVLGAEHPDTLTARHDFAYWTGQAGDVGAARDLFAALLPIQERVLGAEHPDTLATRSDLADWTGMAGDVATARDLFAALLPIQERVLGAEHPDTLATRHNLAYWTGRAGDAATARDLFAALLPVRERVLGDEHPDTLTTRHNLARWTGVAGDAATARDLFAALLPVRERVLGAEHPDTLTARHGLARWTGDADDAATARDLFAALLPVRERVLGPEHPHTLRARHSFARWTGQAGDAATARDLLAALLPVQERILGPEHPHTLITRNDLAYWTAVAEGAHLRST
jgi:Tetratricopeptide repeat